MLECITLRLWALKSDLSILWRPTQQVPKGEPISPHIMEEVMVMVMVK